MIRQMGALLLRRTELFLLLAPFLAGSVLFVLVPMVMTFALSLAQYDLFSPPEFIGAGNYIHFLGDQLFQRALYKTRRPRVPNRDFNKGTGEFFKQNLSDLGAS